MRAAAAALGILLVAALPVPGAQARTSCGYAGAPARVLTVEVTGVGVIGEIRRQGHQIVVNEFLERAQPCAGGTPTVFNTDTIEVRLGRDSFADLRLGGGPFAPGATPEAEGASEIEVRVSGDDVLANVVGTRGPDELRWGAAGATAGLNVNPGIARDRDVDVTIAGSDSFLVASGAAGNDTIVGEPGARIAGTVFSVGGRGADLLKTPAAGGILDGGPGADRLLGSRGQDMLAGGSGDDRVAGGRGWDQIIGGPGRDRLRGGPGDDLIDSRDRAVDVVHCGPGGDSLTADRRDRARGCERVSGRRARSEAW